MSTNTKPVQFDWRRHWPTKVAPHLAQDQVQEALDRGMSLYDPNWQRGDPPHLIGGVTGRRVATGKLSWYQPVGRCHGIALFSLVIGLINHPELAWKIVSCRRHAVAVGYGPDDGPRVVMDILLFDSFTAEESLAFADAGVTDEEYFAGLREWLPAGSTEVESPHQAAATRRPGR